MTSIPKYTHQDVVNFLRDQTTPEDISCSIGFNLVRQPVMLHGDPSQRPYEATSALKALETKRENPFTRGAMTAYPALHVDHARLDDAKQFRAMLLGYTKVAAYLQEQGQSARLGEALLPRAPEHGAAPKPPTLQQIAAGQTIWNSYVRHKAQRAPEQPRLAEYYHDMGVMAYERGVDALPRIERVVGEAERIAYLGDVMAVRTEREAPTSPAFSFGSAEDDLWPAARSLGIDPAQFTADFGAPALEAMVDVVGNHLSSASVTLAEKITQRNQRVSDALLSQDGALLHALLKSRNYEDLVRLMPHLTAAQSAHWSIELKPDGKAWYLGQQHNGQENGLGLAMATSGASYMGGQWAAGALHGLGRAVGPRSISAGQWYEGTLVHGRASGPGSLWRGRMEAGDSSAKRVGVFAKRGLTETGIWNRGVLTQGKSEQGSDYSAAWVGAQAPAQGYVGRAHWSTGKGLAEYHGEFTRGKPHGFGAVEEWGVMHTGDWQQGRLTGPGSRSSPLFEEYGTWLQDGRFRVENAIRIADE